MLSKDHKQIRYIEIISVLTKIVKEQDKKSFKNHELLVLKLRIIIIIGFGNIRYIGLE